MVHLKEAGDIPSGSQRNFSRPHEMDHTVFLYGTIKGKSKQVHWETGGASDSNSFENESEGSSPQTFRCLQPFNTPPTDEKGTPAEEKLIFLAATSAFDIDSPVALRGSIFYRNGNFTSKAAWLNKVLRKAGERKVVDVDHTTIPSPSISVSNFSPRYTKTAPSGSRGSCFVQIRFKNGLKPDSTHRLQLVTEGFYDGHGKRTDRPSGYKWNPTIPGFFGGVDQINAPEYTVTKWFHNEAITKTNSEIKVKLAVTIGDGWPYLVKAVIWPAWFSERPKTLQLISVVVKGGSVIVNAHYSGSKWLEFKTFDKLNTLRYFDSRKETVDELPPKAATEDRLFTDWSQHFTLPNGLNCWGSYDVSVQDIECDPKNNCRITYTTKALDALKPGQSAKFHADIGIEDDGFLPIDAVITRPKTAPRNPN